MHSWCSAPLARSDLCLNAVPSPSPTPVSWLPWATVPTLVCWPRTWGSIGANTTLQETIRLKSRRRTTFPPNSLGSASFHHQAAPMHRQDPRRSLHGGHRHQPVPLADIVIHQSISPRDRTGTRSAHSLNTRQPPTATHTLTLTVTYVFTCAGTLLGNSPGTCYVGKLLVPVNITSSGPDESVHGDADATRRQDPSPL